MMHSVIDMHVRMFSVPVLYCTLLASAQTSSERSKIEEQMEGDVELTRILRNLQETDSDDLVSEERARRQQARQSRVAANLESMDVDEHVVWRTSLSECQYYIDAHFCMCMYACKYLFYMHIDLTEKSPSCQTGL